MPPGSLNGSSAYGREKALKISRSVSDNKRTQALSEEPGEGVGRGKPLSCRRIEEGNENRVDKGLKNCNLDDCSHAEEGPCQVELPHDRLS